MMYANKILVFVLRRALEICNYMPIKNGTKITIPYETAHGTKVDPRSVIPMFSMTYVWFYRDGNVERKKRKLAPYDTS